MANNNDKKVLNVPDKRVQNDARISSAEREEQVAKTQLKGNVPALRFPEFTGEWIRHKLSEMCSFYSGGTPSSSKKEFYNGNIPFIRSGELHKDKTELFITEDGLNNSAAKLVETGDLLLALYGATSGDIAISKIKGAINQAILCIRTKQNKKFIESVWNKHVERLLQTYLQGGQGNLSADIVKNIPFYFANLEEQDKLANFISLLDERISTQNKIIEDLKKLKSALYQEMFGNLVAQTLKLGQIAEIIKGEQVNGTELLEQGKYYVMNGGTLPSGWLNKYNTEANTISISEGGNSCGYVQYNTSRYWSGGHCYSLKILHPQETSDLYLYHFLKWQEENIMALRIGSGLPNIQKKDLLRFPVILPTITQQNKIVSTLSVIEKKVWCEISITKYFIKQKEYLLSQLFI